MRWVENFYILSITLCLGLPHPSGAVYPPMIPAGRDPIDQRSMGGYPDYLYINFFLSDFFNAMRDFLCKSWVSPAKKSHFFSDLQVEPLQKKRNALYKTPARLNQLNLLFNYRLNAQPFIISFMAKVINYLTKAQVKNLFN